jgi:hypothetical protein
MEGGGNSLSTLSQSAVFPVPYAVLMALAAVVLVLNRRDG